MLFNSARARVRSNEYWFEEERMHGSVWCSVCVFSQLPIVAIMGKKKE